MRNVISIFFLFIITSCSVGNNVSLEEEIIFQTIEKLTPEASEVDLFVPASGGENSLIYEARKNEFWTAHNRIKENDSAYYILSDQLFVPEVGERYVTRNGISESFIDFLFKSSSPRKINPSPVSKLHNLSLNKDVVNQEDYKSINTPGCYGYVEFSRMMFSENNTKALFLFKYHLNYVMDFTHLVTVTKRGNEWVIDNKKKIFVSYESPDSPLEPTSFLETIQGPNISSTFAEENFEIKFSTDTNMNHALPREQDIIILMSQKAFDENLLGKVNLEFSVDRNSNDLENINFKKINDSTYKMRINKCYSESDIEYDIRITPKRGYIYNDFLEASSHKRSVYHTSAASLGVWWKSVDNIDSLNCK